MLTTMADHRGFGMSVTMGKKLSSFKKKEDFFLFAYVCVFVCARGHVYSCMHLCPLTYVMSTCMWRSQEDLGSHFLGDIH